MRRKSDDRSDIIDRYYDYVNRGDWEQQLTLFSADVTGDEQLAGHFAGISVLQVAIDRLRQRLFPVYPSASVVDRDAALVVWRCVAASSYGVPIAYPDDLNCC